MRTALAAALVLTAVVTAQNAPPPASGRPAPSAAPTAGLEATLARVGSQVEAYFARVRSILATERVILQPLGYDLSAEGFARQLVYELRVEWEPAAGAAGVEPRIARRLLSVNGRAPRPQDERCTDPRLVSPEPLAVFLPNRRDQYAFALAGTARVDGRTATLVDYRDASGKPPDIKWQDDCVSVDVPSQTRGRAWVDADTGDVLRLDERFQGLFEIPVPRSKQRAGIPTSMTIERSDSSIRYKRVRFSDPDETLLLPSSIDTLSIVRNAGTPRLRTTQTFSDYRRFVAKSRLLE